MKAVQTQLAMLLLLLSGSVAQTTDTEMAKIRDIVVAREGEDWRVEVLVSSPVEPVLTERHRDRLVVQLPNTSYFAKKIDVNADGVRTVRTRFDGVEGTEIVVDMDRTHPYSLTRDQNRIVLTLRPTEGLDTTAPRSAAIAHSSVGPGGAGSRQPQPNSQSNARQSSSPQASTPPVSNQVPPLVVAPTAPNTPTTAGESPAVPRSSGSIASESGPVQTAPTPPSHSAPPSPQVSALSQLRPVPEVVSQVVAVPVRPANDTNQSGPTLRLSDPSLRTVFKVKYVAEGVAYLDGGRNAGLKEGVRLEVQETDLPARNGAAVDPSDPRVVAELEVSALAETSAVTEIHSPKRPIKVGDLPIFPPVTPKPWCSRLRSARAASIPPS